MIKRIDLTARTVLRLLLDKTTEEEIYSRVLRPGAINQEAQFSDVSFSRASRGL